MTSQINPDDGIRIAACIAAGQISAVEVMQAAISRAQKVRHLGAISYLAAELGLKSAREIDAHRISSPASDNPPPFLGVPFLMKDLGAAAEGLPTVCGSRSLKPVAASADSDLAARFRSAGLVPFGLTTVPEFGLALSSEPAIGPIARNPLDVSRTPGGSSGGAAAAVAAGIVALAHATDAGGSVRVPAACCGLVGLKPTRGAMPAGPTFGNHLGGIAAELVVSRSLRDTAAVLDACAGRSRGPFPNPDLGGPMFARLDTPLAPLRIGLCTEAGADFPISTAYSEAVIHAAASLQAVGHRIVAIPCERLMPLVRDAAQTFNHIVAVNLARRLGPDPTGVESLTAAIAERGRSMTGRGLQAAEMAGVQVAHAIWQLFDEIDVLITPMLSGPPLPIGSFPHDHRDIEGHWKRMSAFAPFATLANVAGVPALSIPHGTSDGLPLSVQLVGPMCADAVLLRVARQLQTALPWSFATHIAGLPR